MSAALAKGYTNAQLLKLLSVSGFLYYIYNEVAFLALAEVAPVTHAVTNTVKRVVIISRRSSSSRRRSRLALGSGITISAMLYALAEQVQDGAGGGGAGGGGGRRPTGGGRRGEENAPRAALMRGPSGYFLNFVRR